MFPEDPAGEKDYQPCGPYRVKKKTYTERKNGFRVERESYCALPKLRSKVVNVLQPECEAVKN